MDDKAEAPASADAGPPKERNVGEMLKSARAAQGITLEQIATELRIEIRQLEALENDRFDRIGVPVFVKGYLRQYGARLGLDYRDLLAQYYKQTSLQEVQIRPSKTIKLRDERQITVWVIAGLALLVVIAALAVWWLGGGGFDIRGSRAPASQAKPDGAKPAAIAPAETAATPPAAEATQSGAEPAPAGGAAAATDPNATPQPSPAPAVAPASTPAAARPSQSRLGPVSPASSPPPSAAAASTSGAAVLIVPIELTFEEESWAEVNDARGTRLYYGLGVAGRRAEMRGEPPFAVVLGNAGGVKVVVDGQDFKIPTKGRPGEYARFSVDVATD